jgi:hypothetical protein
VKSHIQTSVYKENEALKTASKLSIRNPIDSVRYHRISAKGRTNFNSAFKEVQFTTMHSSCINLVFIMQLEKPL